MRILPQFAAISYSPLPGMPLLPAPTIAGLLPGSTPRKAEIIRETPSQLEPSSVWSFMRTFRTHEELDAEIAVMAEDALDFLSRRSRDRRPL
jgi:hypothetical protein